MSASVRVLGTPYQYEAEAFGGLSIGTGEWYWGSRIRYRPGTSGRWIRFLAIDVHPLDHASIKDAVVAHCSSPETSGE
jgi:hypothetical protein